MSPFPRLTRRGSLLAISAVASGLMGALTGFVDLIRVGAFAAALLVVTVAFVMIRRVEVDVQRRPRDRGRLTAGETDELHLVVRGASGSRLPVTLIERHTFDTPGEERWQLPALPQGTTALMYEVTPQLRGRYRTGPLLAQWSDPLQLAQRQSGHGLIDHWVVWPRIIDLDVGHPRDIGLGQDDAPAQRPAATGFVGASVREYLPGDDIRHVHWGATARQGELMVRQFDPPARTVIRLVLVGDVEQIGTNEEWERLVSLAASVLVHFSHTDIPVELILHQDRFTTAGQTADALDALAAVGRCPSPAHLGQSAPTVLFQHTSAAAHLEAPLVGRALAIVGGTSSNTTVRELSNLGWDTHAIAENDDGVHLLTTLLHELEAQA